MSIIAESKTQHLAGVRLECENIVGHLWFFISSFAGVLLILLGVFAAAEAPLVFPKILSFSEKLISPDGLISARGDFMITWYALSGALVSAGILTLAFQNNHFRHAVKMAILNDAAHHAETARWLPAFFLLFSTLAGAALCFLYVFQHALSIEAMYLEDHFFESLSTALLGASSLLLFLSALNIRKSHTTGEKRAGLLFWLYLILAGFLFIATMEEISWGQRIFGWETPSVLSQVNYQNETNVHNAFNPYFDSFYRLLSVLLGIMFASILLQIRYPKPRALHLLLPHPSLTVLAVMISVAAVGIVKNEIVEELGYLFAFLYSLRVFLCCRSKKRHRPKK